MNTAPRVSIVIPTYNRGRVLARALASVIEQTYADYEIIVVDDGSTDDTAQVIRPWLKRIRYIVQANQGASAARNRGLVEARGELIAFLDSDDEWLPEKLARQVAYLDQHPEIAILACRAAEEETRRFARDVFVNCPNQFELFLWRPFPSNMSRYIVRRECIDRCGLFDCSLQGPEDREFWLRLLQAGYRFDFVEEPLVRYYVSDDSISAHPYRMLAGERAIRNRYIDTLPGSWARWTIRSRHLAKSYWSAAINFRAQGRHWLSCAYLVRSLAVNPLWPFPVRRVATLVKLGLGTVAP